MIVVLIKCCLEPLWKTGRPDLTYEVDVFSPSTKGDGGFGMNLLQNHVALAPVSADIILRKKCTNASFPLTD
jgi:hypothetical protein